VKEEEFGGESVGGDLGPPGGDGCLVSGRWRTLRDWDCGESIGSNSKLRA